MAQVTLVCAMAVALWTSFFSFVAHNHHSYIYITFDASDLSALNLSVMCQYLASFAGLFPLNPVIRRSLIHSALLPFQRAKTFRFSVSTSTTVTCHTDHLFLVIPVFFRTSYRVMPSCIFSNFIAINPP